MNIKFVIFSFFFLAFLSRTIPLHAFNSDTIPAQTDVGLQNLPEDQGTEEKSKSKITPGVPSEFDWIKFLNGNEKEVEIRKISDKYVYFSNPGNMEMQWIDRREVQTIYYRSGRVEQMSKAESEIREVKDWKKVELTYDPTVVQNMIKIDDLEIRIEATTRHHYYKPETLESSAVMVLKKNAALIKADVILVTKKEHHRAYGDAPSIYMAGTAYRER
jgi:hypothetical protein